MSNYVLVSEEGEVLAYPYSLAALVNDNPGTSFPDEMPDDGLADFGVFPVEPTPPPASNAVRQIVEGDPALDGDVWKQVWKAVDLPIEEARAELWDATKLERDKRTRENVTVPGIGVFDTDDASLFRINGAVTMALIAAQAGQPFTISWKLADNTVTTLDGAQMVAVGLAAGQHVAACHARSQALGLAIQAAEDVVALEAIDIGAGWPGGEA